MRGISGHDVLYAVLITLVVWLLLVLVGFPYAAVLAVIVFLLLLLLASSRR